MNNYKVLRLEENKDLFLSGKIVVNTPTHELSKKLMKWCYENSIGYNTTDTVYMAQDYFLRYEEQLCYRINEQGFLRIGNLGGYKECGHEIYIYNGE